MTHRPGTTRSRAPRKGDLQGIVIVDGHDGAKERRRPKISAFIWGGKTAPSPTLPFGRWKGVA
jgi:hypothetical protein